MNRMIDIIKNASPKSLIIKVLRRALLFLPDALYLKLFYKWLMHRPLDLDNPRSYTEKIQWLKLYDRNPLYTKMVCKYDAKEYVKSILGQWFVKNGLSAKPLCAASQRVL